MKVIWLTLFVFISAYVQAQTCNPSDCVSDETTEVYSDFNKNCSGSWMPDVDVCWGTQSTLGGDICVIMIWNNSSTESIIVDVTFNVNSYLNISIGPGSCYAFGFPANSGTATITFKNSSGDTCIADFYMNCV